MDANTHKKAGARIRTGKNATTIRPTTGFPRPDRRKNILVGLIIFIIVATVVGGVIPILFSTGGMNAFGTFFGIMLIPLVLVAVFVVAVVRAVISGTKPKK